MAFGRQDGQPRAVAFERRIGGHGCAVHDALQIARLQRQAPDAGQDALRLVVAASRCLQDLQPPLARSRKTRSVKVPPTSTPSQFMPPNLLPSA